MLATRVTTREIASSEIPAIFKGRFDSHHHFRVYNNFLKRALFTFGSGKLVSNLIKMSKHVTWERSLHIILFVKWAKHQNSKLLKKGLIWELVYHRDLLQTFHANVEHSTQWWKLGYNVTRVIYYLSSAISIYLWYNFKK